VALSHVVPNFPIWIPMVFCVGNKVREGPTLVGVFLEGTTSTCYNNSFVARKKTP
jgi:hypothetical protein